jgi:hypothetical protein
MPELTPDELRVLKIWIASDLIANAMGGDDSPTPNDPDEEAMWRIIAKFAA